MMQSVTSLTRSGLKDWFLQRISAVILTIYIFFLIGYCLGHANFDYSLWKALFYCNWMRDFTLLAVLSLIIHAWLGMWTVFTDYIHCVLLRGFIQIAVIIACLLYFIWAIAILWG